MAVKKFIIVASDKFKRGLDKASALANSTNSGFVRDAVLSAAKVRLFYAENAVRDIQQINENQNFLKENDAELSKTMSSEQLACGLVKAFKEIAGWKKVLALLEENEDE